MPCSDSSEAATAYWASVAPYVGHAPWSDRIAAAVARYQPDSVLEFGANAGRNLVAVRSLLPTATLCGIDINVQSVLAGREKWDLDLRVGGVDALHGLAFDLAFTVSVIDHLPDPVPAVKALVDAAPTVLLCEPWTGTAGRLISRTSSETGETVVLTDYSYSWDYERIAADLGVDVTIEPFPLESPLGPHYQLFRLRRAT